MANKPMRALGQVNQGTWAQETYESASRDAGRRARQLRKAGYSVTVSSLGSQVTPVGIIKLSTVDIRPGRHADTFKLPTEEWQLVKLRNVGKKKPSTLTASALNRELDSLEKQISKVNHQLIDAGRGYEKYSELMQATDPLAVKMQTLENRYSELIREVQRRHGPYQYRALSRRTVRIMRNAKRPAPAFEIGEPVTWPGIRPKWKAWVGKKHWDGRAKIWRYGVVIELPTGSRGTIWSAETSLRKGRNPWLPEIGETVEISVARGKRLTPTTRRLEGKRGRVTSRQRVGQRWLYRVELAGGRQVDAYATELRQVSGGATKNAGHYNVHDLVRVPGKGRQTVIGMVHDHRHEADRDKYYVVFPDTARAQGLDAGWFDQDQIIGPYDPNPRKGQGFCKWCGSFYRSKTGRRLRKASPREARKVKSHGICAPCAAGLKAEYQAGRSNPNGPAEWVHEAALRRTQEGERGVDWVFTWLSKADRDAFDAWLVQQKHPLAYEPGTQEQRFKAYVREYVAKRGRKRNAFTGQVRGNEVYFTSHGRRHLGWIHKSTPTRYLIWSMPGMHSRRSRPSLVWRRKSDVELVSRRARSNGSGAVSATNPGDPVRTAARMAELFNGQPPRHVSHVEFEMPRSLFHIGPCAQVDYISDKWREGKKQYYHIFEGDAQLYAVPEPMPDGRTALLILGDFKIKPEGITG